MDSRRQNPTNVAWWRRRRRSRGAGRWEVLLAMLIVVLGAGLFLALVARIQQRRNCAGYIRDLRVFSAAFGDYYQRRHAWPPASSSDVALPPEMARALEGSNWRKGSPFGGNYGWVAPEPAGAADSGPGHGWGGRGAVILTAFAPGFPLTLDKSDLLYIDGQVDDGNLATGRFRTGFNGWPVFLVEAAKQ